MGRQLRSPEVKAANWNGSPWAPAKSMDNKTSRRSFLVSSLGSALVWAADGESTVQLMKAPNGGLQPQAVADSKGVIHVIYLYGDPAAADIGYVRKPPGGRDFSPPIRVNSALGSAI